MSKDLMSICVKLEKLVYHDVSREEFYYKGRQFSISYDGSHVLVSDFRGRTVNVYLKKSVDMDPSLKALAKGILEDIKFYLDIFYVPRQVIEGKLLSDVSQAIATIREDYSNDVSLDMSGLVIEVVSHVEELIKSGGFKL